MTVIIIEGDPEVEVRVVEEIEAMRELTVRATDLTGMTGDAIGEVQARIQATNEENMIREIKSETKTMSEKRDHKRKRSVSSSRSSSLSFEDQKKD